MHDLLRLDDLVARIAPLGLADWLSELRPMLLSRVSADAHGDFQRWFDIVAALPGAADDPSQLRQLLLGLAPWRKGPFVLGGIEIDSEWRSDMKWARLQNAIAPLEGRHVLDVGCGNGYYALNMSAAGAKLVLGIDPTLLYVMQFGAVNIFERNAGVYVLPLRLQDFPPAATAFDTTFSMGVLYHQRAPIDHLRQLRDTLKPGGQLVLETLIVPGAESYACTPADRYARMRNVWLLPTVAELTTWMTRSGYREIELINETVTSTDEQRTTEWMPFESLREALAPDDPSKTVEGWPAPRRVIVTATAP
ncbi:MAG: tRNA 5-methoxyuridine(34)/uridine 5-oxyacetic acid(34) synthase CmoB [Gammaproteobacteria bacterium]|nr:tRNA 5-methoxyuridine(34)/uridine 5-oxyacetic acid(34) synthase CmoB [Gammaproteobacteria bacterium]